MAGQKQVKVSEQAYYMLKSKSKSPEYKGRGVTGVVDMLLFGKFTTQGSGRPIGSLGKAKKTQKKGLTF